MKQHDERIYRKPTGRPTLEVLKSQLSRCREDYARLAGKDLASDLKRALQLKIAELESQVADLQKAAVTAAAAAAEEDDGPEAVSSAPAANRGTPMARRGAGTRTIPPRFRAIRS